MDDIARRDRFRSRESRAGDVPGQNQVTGQPLPSWHESGEAHPGVQRDPCLLRKNLDRAERLDHGERAIEGCPYDRRRPIEVPVKVAERRAGMRLIAVGECAPARAALPQWPHAINLTRVSYGRDPALMSATPASPRPRP